jgi:formiminoglutamase
MNKLPVLISIPHGGIEVPIAVKDRIIFSDVDLFDDSDSYTIDIYDLGEKVSVFISASIARAFVDLNRAPDDLPHRNNDNEIFINRPFAGGYISNKYGGYSLHWI